MRPSHLPFVLAISLLARGGADLLEAGSLDIPSKSWGISFGNSPEFVGLRLNYRDNAVRRIDGVNLTLWQPRDDDNQDSLVRGLSLGLIPGGGQLRGIQIGLLGVAGGKDVRGLTIGLLGAGTGGDLEGISIGGLGIGAGGSVSGLNLGLVGVGAGEDLAGFNFGGVGVGAGRNLTGLNVGLVGIGAGGNLLGINIGGIGGGAGGDVKGLSLAAIGMGAGKRLVGVTIAGIGAGAGDEMVGLTVAGIGAGAPTVRGVMVGGVAVGARDCRGVAIALGTVRMRGDDAARFGGLAISSFNDIRGIQRGVAIGIVNYARELHGLQLGLINIARNNRPGLRVLPLLNAGGARSSDLGLSPSTANRPGRQHRGSAGAGALGDAESAVTPRAEDHRKANRLDLTLPRSVTLPFTLDHNRMLVELEFPRADGTVRRATAWVDTGNQFLILGESLARDLGIDLSALQASGTGHSVELASPSPSVSLAGLPLDLEGIKLRVHPGTQVRPGVPAEVCLPASALRHDHVVFDYPERRLTVARPGTLEPRGVAIPCRVNPETGLFMIHATLDGEAVPLGIDTGSAGTWVSNVLTQAWQERHPEWPTTHGAVGSANFFGFDLEVGGALMRLPELGLDPLHAREVGVLGLDPGLFEWYSRKSAGPVVGFIGANVLTRFRLEVDFTKQATYWEAGPEPALRDLDMVGLTLRPEEDGRLVVAGVPTKDDRPTVEGVQPGDTLVRVDHLDATTATMGAVIDALRGTPGETRTLLLERDGRRITVEAQVTRFP